MKVVTFGEIMLRLAPNGYYRFFRMTNFKQPSAAATVLEQDLSILCFRANRAMTQ